VGTWPLHRMVLTGSSWLRRMRMADFIPVGRPLDSRRPVGGPSSLVCFRRGGAAVTAFFDFVSSFRFNLIRV